MLERMRRPERQGTLREKLGWQRGAIPDLAIRTTCLVGFPGETDDDFRELLAFLEEEQFDRLCAFSYSSQEGTRATRYPDDVSDAVKRERLEELLEVQRAISAERLARFVGREAAGARLVESEQRFRLALEASRVGVWELDFATGAARWSDTLGRL